MCYRNICYNLFVTHYQDCNEQAINLVDVLIKMFVICKNFHYVIKVTMLQATNCLFIWKHVKFTIRKDIFRSALRTFIREFNLRII